MLHPSTKRLIDKLGDMTRRQKVAWQESEDGNITHDTEGYRVTLTAEPHAVLLTDSQGREIETCNPAEFADELDADGRPYAHFVEELYREAKRHARGAEEAISAVLAGLDAVEAPADMAVEPAVEEPTEEPTEAVEATEDTIEDPLDDSSPLDADDYAEMDSQSEDITFAVASLADQVNGASMIAPHAAEEDDILTGENTAVAATDVDMDTTSDDEFEPEATSGDTVATDGDTAATSGDTAQQDTIEAFSVTPDDEPAALEEIDDTTPLNEPAGGFTPTGFVTSTTEEVAPDVAAELPVADAIEDPEPVEAATDHAYAPAFADDAADAPGYAQAEPFKAFTTTPEEAPETSAPDAERVEETSAAIAPQYAEAASETTAEAADVVDSDAEAPTEPAPAPQGNIANTGGFFGAGYGSSLSAYRSEPATEDAVESMPETPSADAEPSEPHPVETVEAPQPSPEPMRSFSLSGITAPREPVETPAPLEASTPDPAEPAPDVVIDGTSDLPTWLGHDTPDAYVEDDAVEPIAEYETPQPVEAPQTAAPPEPEFVSETTMAAEQPATVEEEAVEPERPAPRPVKRFNPWN